MRPAIAHAARSLVAFFVLGPAFVACQASSNDDRGPAPDPSNQLSEAEAARAARAGECGPDETPERVCKDLPDGGVECEIVCVPAEQCSPECDKGTHPVKACKPSDGPDLECFLICLPDDQPPPVDPDECGPGTHPVQVCDAPGPWPVPPFPGDPRPEPVPAPDEPRDLPANGGTTTPPDYPNGGECKIVCMPDFPPFPECPPGTFPEKVCRFDPATGTEECFLECIPDGGEPPPGPVCPDGTTPSLNCKDDGDCEVVCVPEYPGPGPGCPNGTVPEVECKDVGNGEVACEIVCTPKDLPLPLPQPAPKP